MARAGGVDGKAGGIEAGRSGSRWGGERRARGEEAAGDWMEAIDLRNVFAALEVPWDEPTSREVLATVMERLEADERWARRVRRVLRGLEEVGAAAAVARTSGLTH